MTALEKIKAGQPVSVVFMGGSITHGAHASTYEHAWAARVAAAMTNRYGPLLRFRNAGVGGTGSGLGVFRLEKDVLPWKPDILFLEFAVNDVEDSIHQPEKVLICMEGIIRQLVSDRPDISIVLVFTTNQEHTACVSLHKRIADYYGLPCIDLQEVIRQDVAEGKYVWQDMATDFWHPNDIGHTRYADIITGALEAEPERYFGQKIQMRQPLMAYHFRAPELVPAGQAEFHGSWQSVDIHVPGKLDTVICSDQPGDSFEFRFTGRCFGLYNQISRDAGILTGTIDDNVFLEVDMYYDIEPYCASSIQKIDLDPGEHVVHLTVSDKRNGRSTGNWVRVGCFLTDEEAAEEEVTA